MPVQGRAAADGIGGGRGDRDGLPSTPRQVRTHASIQHVQPSPRVLGCSCIFAHWQDSAGLLLSQSPLLCRFLAALTKTDDCPKGLPGVGPVKVLDALDGASPNITTGQVRQF